MPPTAPRRSPGDARRLDMRTAAQALSAHSAREATMTEVARELGMAKPTLYRLAGSRAHLLEACLDAEAERLLDHLRESLGPSERPGRSLVERTLRGVHHYAEDSPGGFALLLEQRAPGAEVRINRIEAWIADLARRESDHDAPRELVAAAVLGAAASLVSRARLLEGEVDMAATGRELAAALVAERD